MDHQALTAILFLSVVALTLFITIRASRNTSGTTDFYAGGRSFSGFQNGLAIGGDYMSAASFLGISGAIALSGYDGFLYSIGFLVAWLVALLLVAEMLRNSGRFTMADQLAYRMRQRPVRTAAATSTVVVSIFYLLAQMVGAGSLVVLLLGIDADNTLAISAVIAGVGALMIIYVTVGGMKGTTWVQIVKAVLLMVGSAVIVVMVLAKFDFNLSELLGAASSNSGKAGFLEPGLKYGIDLTTKLDFLSLGIALVLGTAGLPHILVRFYTVPTSRDARKSVLWAIGLIGVFYLFTLVLGFGAAALLKTGAGSDVAASGGNLASPLLAEAVGGKQRGGAARGGGPRCPPPRPPPSAHATGGRAVPPASAGRPARIPRPIPRWSRAQTRTRSRARPDAAGRRGRCRSWRSPRTAHPNAARAFYPHVLRCGR
mgnify:CR=1 FL=1